MTKRIAYCSALIVLIIWAIAFLSPIRRTAHADGIGAGNTVDSTLTLDGNYSAYLAIPSGSGNWVTVNVDPARKYYVRNFGIDHTGATASNKIKVLLNSALEPDAGSGVVYTAAGNVEIIKPDEAVYPIKGTKTLSFKADTSETMLIVRTIETEPTER